MCTNLSTDEIESLLNVSQLTQRNSPVLTSNPEGTFFVNEELRLKKVNVKLWKSLDECRQKIFKDRIIKHQRQKSFK